MATQKNLIMVPYAEIPTMETGTSVAAKKVKDRKAMYLKNCCVACVSAKHNNPECAVALVTNIDVPLSYIDVLKRGGVEVIYLPFEQFNFGDGYTWGLAFYKLCAQHYVVHALDYDHVLCIDSDVYVQGNLQTMWAEADGQLLICGTIGDTDFCREAQAFTNSDGAYIRYGGEFIVGTSAMLKSLTEQELCVFQKMKGAGFRTVSGDEFIVSIVLHNGTYAFRLVDDLYISRFWTGAYRRVFPGYKNVPLLHVPLEKWAGMITLYDRYISQNRIPEKRIAYHLLHLDHRSPQETAKYLLKKALGKI